MNESPPEISKSLEIIPWGCFQTMNDSDNELLSSAVDGLVEDEDWTDTTWAQPVLPGASRDAASPEKQPVKPGLSKAATSPKPYRQGSSQYHGIDKAGLQSIGSLVRDVQGTEEWNSQLKALKESVTATDTSVVNRMSLNDNKAGMEGLDKDKINQIIHEASKGSKFYENERKKEEQMKRRIEEQKLKIGRITEEQLQQGLTEADRLLEEFECHRDLSHTIIHIDMDAFYAAVEMRDDPSLKDKPMAVGGTAMLSTSNYHARKFGVRAAMPGFIGKKLCPDLIIVPTNFEKYTAVSKHVRSIMSDYDPNFCPMSLDEAYLDITDHLDKRLFMSESERTFLCRDKAFVDSKDHCLCDLNEGEKKNKLLEQLAERKAVSGELNLGSCEECGLQLPPFSKVIFGTDNEEAVRELRTRIEQRTRLTASAGIAPNMMLAKVCSDKNKPNGQYKVPATREEVLDFVKDLSTRKISGIGKVSETILNAIGVFTCTDLYEKRALLYHLYSPISFNYFMRICLGIGSVTVERDSERKSISMERTFSEISKPADLYKKCEELCESLAEDLKEEQMKGKTVAIKLKTVKFEVKTRAHTLAHYTHDKDEILQAATDLLRTEMQACAPQPLRLRPMGVRMSSLLHQSHCKKTQRQNTITGLLKKMAQKTGKDTIGLTPNGQDPETASEASVKAFPVDEWPDIKAPDVLSTQFSADLQICNTDQSFVCATTASHGHTTTKQEKQTKLKETQVNETDNASGEKLALIKAKSNENEHMEDQNNNTDRNLKQLKWETVSNKNCGQVQNRINGSCKERCEPVQKDSFEDKKQEHESFKNDTKEQKSSSSKEGFNVSVDNIDNKTKSFEQREMDMEENALTKPETEGESSMHNTFESITSQLGNPTTDDKDTDVEKTECRESVDNPDRQDDEPVLYTPGRCTRSGLKGSPRNIESRKRRNSKRTSRTSLSAYVCPVCCQNMLFKDLNQFNEHIDDCMAERDTNSNHFPAPKANKNQNQQNAVRNTIVKLEAESFEHGCDNKQMLRNGNEEKTITLITEEIKSRGSNSSLKGDPEKIHIDSALNNTICMNREIKTNSDNEITTVLQHCSDDSKMEGNDQNIDFKDKDRKANKKIFHKHKGLGTPVEIVAPLESDPVNNRNHTDISDVNEDLKELRNRNDEFCVNNQDPETETSGSDKEAILVKEAQNMEINVCSTVDTRDSEDIKSQMPNMCLQSCDTSFDTENQCDIVSSTNENDSIDHERIATKDNPIQVEPDLPCLPDLNCKTNDENHDSSTDVSECLPETKNKIICDTLVDSLNNSKTKISDKILDESKVEKLIECLIDRTITDDTVKLDDIKGSKCETSIKDTRRLKLDIPSPSNVIVHDCEMPSGSEENVMQEEDVRMDASEDSTNRENVIQEEFGAEPTNEENRSLLVCPICNIEQRVSDLAAFNDHVDSCLSRGTISQILKEQRGDSGDKTKLKRSLPTSGQKSAKRQKTNIKMPSCRSIASFFQGK